MSCRVGYHEKLLMGLAQKIPHKIGNLEFGSQYGQPYHSLPSKDGNLVIGGKKGLFKATPEGKVLWHIVPKTPNSTMTSIQTMREASDGMIYAGTDAHSIIKVSPAGELVWLKMYQYCLYNDEIIPNDQYVYFVGTAGLLLHRLSIDTDKYEHYRLYNGAYDAYPDGSGILPKLNCVCAAPDGTLLVGDAQRYVMRATADGNTLSVFRLASEPRRIVLDHAGESLLVILGRDVLAKVALDGTEIWRTPLGGYAYADCLCAHADGYIYVAITDYVLKIEESGRIIAKVYTGSGNAMGMSVAGNQLYICGGGRVTIVDKGA